MTTGMAENQGNWRNDGLRKQPQPAPRCHVARRGATVRKAFTSHGFAWMPRHRVRARSREATRSHRTAMAEMRDKARGDAGVPK